jgi:hypothetical protein
MDVKKFRKGEFRVGDKVWLEIYPCEEVYGSQQEISIKEVGDLDLRLENDYLVDVEKRSRGGYHARRLGETHFVVHGIVYPDQEQHRYYSIAQSLFVALMSLMKEQHLVPEDIKHEDIITAAELLKLPIPQDKLNYILSGQAEGGE